MIPSREVQQHTTEQRRRHRNTAANAAPPSTHTDVLRHRFCGGSREWSVGFLALAKQHSCLCLLDRKDPVANRIVAMLRLIWLRSAMRCFKGSTICSRALKATINNVLHLQITRGAAHAHKIISHPARNDVRIRTTFAGYTLEPPMLPLPMATFGVRHNKVIEALHCALVAFPIRKN